jgi:hypothetical protein
LANLLADKMSVLHERGCGVVELGAGTGAVIARIAKDSRFDRSEFSAGDFSPSSINIINYVAQNQGVSIRTGLFDFHSDTNALNLASSCTLLSSFAIAYVQGLDATFWARLAATRPNAIVLAEPIYQFYGGSSLLGLLRRRYYEANDYSTGILPSIEAAQRDGLLTVIEIEKNVFGVNPLCPISLISLRFN